MNHKQPKNTLKAGVKANNDFVRYGNEICTYVREGKKRFLVSPRGVRIPLKKDIRKYEWFKRPFRVTAWLMEEDYEEVGSHYDEDLDCQVEDDDRYERCSTQEKYSHFDHFGITDASNVLLFDEYDSVIAKIPLEHLIDIWILQQIKQKDGK